MSDEKKVNNQDEPTVLGKVEILVLSDGNVSVCGPVENPVIMMNIFGKAMCAVANHVATKLIESQGAVPAQPNIVVPK